VAEKLVNEHSDLAEIDLYFQAFDIPTPHGYEKFGESWIAYTIGTISEGSDDSILEMAEDLGISPSGIASSLGAPPKIWPTKNIFRLFISHISQHREKATRLRDCLVPFHISSFVAHEDIKPTELWEKEIERALQVMDGFLAIHTEGFSKSVWTQQEIGFAVARGVKIISFEMGEDPTGFLSKHQALARMNRTAEAIALEVSNILETDDLTRNRMAQVQRANRPSPAPNDFPF